MTSKEMSIKMGLLYEGEEPKPYLMWERIRDISKVLEHRGLGGFNYVKILGRKLTIYALATELKILQSELADYYEPSHNCYLCYGYHVYLKSLEEELEKQND